MRIEPAKRIGEVTHYVADLRKARALLGYEPATDLETGIAQAQPDQEVLGDDPADHLK